MSEIVNDIVEYLTAGETLADNDALYVSDGTGNDSGRTAGRAYKLDVTNKDRRKFVGFAKGPATSGNQAKYVYVGRKSGFSALTQGNILYGSITTPGSYQTSEPTSNSLALGVAMSASKVLVGAGLAGAFKPAQNYKNNLIATVVPTVTDDSASGYAAGSLWYNQTSNLIYVCESASIGTALWQVTPAVMVGDSGSGGVQGSVPAPAAGDMAAGKFLNAGGGWSVPAGGGGSGSGSTDLNAPLNAAELAQSYPMPQNTILDSFDTDTKGTKVNCSASADALRVTLGQTAASYTRTKDSTPSLTAVQGYYVGSLQALAPKGTTIAANVIKFSGDCAEFFVSTKKVIIAKKQIFDSEVVHTALLDTDTFVAQLVVSSSSYNSGTDETSLTLTNPNSLDLSMGLVNTSYNTILRVIPFDIQTKAKSLTAGSLDQLDITDVSTYSDVSGVSIVRLPGENFLKKLAGITGKVTKLDGAMSANKQYGVVRVLEYNGGGGADGLYHYFYTINSGVSWVKLSVTFGLNVPTTEEAGAGYNYLNSQQLSVANNGKFFGTHYRWNGTINVTMGVFADLSKPTPVIALVSDNAGVIKGGVSNASGCYGDPIDNSYFVTVAYDATNVYMIVWTWVGDVITRVGDANSGSGVATQAFSNPSHGVVCGTSGAHRFHFSHYNGSAYLQILSLYEGSLSYNTTTSGSAGFHCLGIKQNGSNGLVAFGWGGSGTTGDIFYTDTGAISGTLSWTRRILSANSGVPIDLFVGYSAASNVNLYKVTGRDILVNPSTANHVLICEDRVHPDGVSRSLLQEVCDITSFQGASISCYTQNTTSGLRSSSAETLFGQTFTGSSTRVRTVGLKVYQNGTIASGATLSCSIYNTSGGLPTTLLASAVNTYDASLISKSTSSQWVYFNFANPAALTGTYAIVVNASYAINASNHILVSVCNTSGYAGGGFYKYDGATWTLVSSTHDLVFEINGEYLTDLSVPLTATDIQTAFHTTVSPYNRPIYNQESQIERIDNGSVQYITRRTIIGTDANRVVSGHPFRRVISWGVSGTRSVITDAKIAGYAEGNYDRNLLLNTSIGNTENATINTVTGALSTTVLYNDMSGTGVYMVDAALETGTLTYAADASFQSGQCGVFNGSTMFAYNNLITSVFGLLGTPFVIEAEIKIASLASSFNIFSTYAAASLGFIFQVSATTGKVYVYTNNAAGGSIAESQSVEALTTGVKYVVRASYNGSGFVRLFVDGVELTYVLSQNVTATIGSSTSPRIGGTAANPTANGRIGYVKIAVGATTFNYVGYKSQASLVSIQNLGTKVACKQTVGSISGTTYANNYNNPTIIDGTANEVAVVDSYDLIVSGKKTLTSSGKQITLELDVGRGSNRNRSSVQGVIYTFTK